MKRKLISIMLSIAVLISFVPFFSIQAEASSVSTTLLKTKTVTIKPGKTYKTPVFKLSKKMALQLPLDAWIYSKDKGSSYTIESGKLVITLKNSKNKKVDSYSQTLEGYGKKNENPLSKWYWFNKKGTKKGNYDVGKYYFEIKNTSKRIIQVKYSLNGFTYFSNTASFKKKMTIKSGKYYKLGKIGSGLPLIKKIEFVDFDDEMCVYYRVDKDGNTSLMAVGFGHAKVRITLASGKTYDVKITMKKIN